MTEFAEKRDFLRMPIDCELSFSEHGDSVRHQGNVINLSSKGILFTSRQQFDVGARLEIVLTASNSLTPPMRALAVVSRCDQTEALFDVACEFERIES